MTMPAGTYYVGDLCYVMHPEWDEFCDITINGEQCNDGEFTLKDGRRFATYGTMYGDGMYRSNIGTDHSVDAGLIGCIRIEDIRDPVATVAHMKGLGSIITFDAPFETCVADGIIFIGHVEINTGDIEDDDVDCLDDSYDYDED
jgi:hypothetical protein